MSLTSFLKNKNVKDKFQQEFKKPQFNTQRKLQASPLSKNFALVGTAFDYLLRFYIEHLNPHAITNMWASCKSLYLLELAQRPDLDESTDPIMQRTREKIIQEPSLSDPCNYRKIKGIIQNAKRIHDEFIKKGLITSDLYKAVLRLAQADAIYRRGRIHSNLGKIDEGDIADLEKLISIVKPELFRTEGLCILNPEFGKASQLVGGADVDLVIDDAIIDIKTTMKLKLKTEYFTQLMGYYTLYEIGGIDGMPREHKIKRLGLYFSRHAVLWYIDVQEIIDESTFPHFIEWFCRRANEVYKSSLPL